MASRSFTIDSGPINRSFTITQDGESRSFEVATGVGPAGTTLFSGLTDKATADIPTINTPLASALSGKQVTLVSGTNIKTINGTSLLGSGDITVGDTYTLPIATDSVLGGIKSSTDILVDAGTGVATVNATTDGNTNRGKPLKTTTNKGLLTVGQLIAVDGVVCSTTVTVGQNTGTTPNTLRIYKSNNPQLATLAASNITADRAFEFPDQNGTIALTSDIPDVSGYLLLTGGNMLGGIEMGGEQITGALAVYAETIHTQTITADGTYFLTVPEETGTLATREYADSLVVGLLDDRGNYDASGNTFPASGGSGTAGAVLKGDLWTISVAGTLGGSAVTAGDVLRVLTDTPGQTAGNWVITENNLGYVPQNTAGTLALGGFSSITGTLAIANVADETATRLATAFNAGTEDTTAADSDRIAVISPAGGWMSLTTLWTWITGKLSAAFYRPLIVKKSTAQMDVTSSSTFADITGLTAYSLEADTVYRIEFFGIVTAGASGGYKVGINSTAAFFHTTAGTQGLGAYWQTVGNASLPFQIDSTNIQINARTGASTALPMTSIIYIRTGASAPTVKFQFAQNVSNGTTSSLIIGAVGSFTKLI